MKKVFLIFSVLFMLLLVACNDTQSEKTIKNITVENSGTGIYEVDTEINVNDYKLNINYSDSTSEKVNLTKEMCSNTKFSEVGLQTINVEYKYNDKSYFTAFVVTIVEKSAASDKELVSIEVINSGDNVYEQNSTLTYENFKVKLNYSNQSIEYINLTSDMCSKTTLTDLGEQTIEVTYSYNGKELKTSFVINVYDEWDYYDYINEKEEEKKLTIIIDELNSLIPTELEEDIVLPMGKDYSNKFRIVWKSSNSSVLSNTGKVIKAKEDTIVTLSVKITGDYVEENLSWDINIKGKGEAVLKDISTGKKLVFAYVYEGTYIPIKEEDAADIDVINYCFGYVINGKLQANLSHIMELQELRYKYGVRLVLSIGNYRDDTGYYGGFGPACKTLLGRTTLINSIIDFLKENDFDGVDIDWEYPGWSGLDDSSAVDKDNFSLLCSELRVALDEYKKGMLLTSAVIAGLNEAGISKYYNVAELNKYLDYIHIMTYDLNISSTASHHTNLYSGTRGYSVENSIKCFVNLGAAPSKMVIGVAFYGKISELVTPVTNLSAVRDQPVKETKTIQYTDIKNGYLNKAGYDVLYDSANGADYITNGTIFITYDSPKTIAMKVDMAVDYELAGVMFWDYGSDATGELMRALAGKIKYVNQN